MSFCALRFEPRPQIIKGRSNSALHAGLCVGNLAHDEEVEDDEEAEVVDDWSVYECLYLAQGLTGVTTVSRR